MDHAKTPAEAATRENCDLVKAAQRAVDALENVRSYVETCEPHLADPTELQATEEGLRTALSHQQQGAESELVRRLRNAAISHTARHNSDTANLFIDAADALSRAPQPDTVTEVVEKCAEVADAKAEEVRNLPIGFTAHQIGIKDGAELAAMDIAKQIRALTAVLAARRK